MGSDNKYNWRFTGTLSLIVLILSGFEADAAGGFQFPHAVQQVMSKEKTPVLAGTIPSFERFMTSWEKLAKKNEHLAPAIKIGLKFAYKYYRRMDDTSAYMVAMCESIYL